MGKNLQFTTSRIDQIIKGMRWKAFYNTPETYCFKT